MIKKTLYFGNPAYLSFRNKQLVITLPSSAADEEGSELPKSKSITRPIEDIGIIVLDNPQITITGFLMSALLANNVGIITCDEKHMPAGLHLPLSGHSEQSERFQNQIEASAPLKKQLWQQTVKAKIWNQACALSKARGCKVGCMKAWSQEVKSGDTDNLEGRAAAYYWRNFFGDDGFKRGRFEDMPNGLLNYGYAILRGVCARALVSSGLLPTLGIHHKNKYNAYCLADDMMEPYRPYVDLLVSRIYAAYGPEVELTSEIKAQLLGVTSIEVCLNGKRSPLMVAMSTTTSSLAKCYEGTSRKILYPEMKLE